MTTAATITANLILNSGEFQRGMKQAEKATTQLQGKVGGLMNFIGKNAKTISVFADGFVDLGKKMTTVISLPIIGFFTLLISKAMAADTELSKMAKESAGKLNEQLTIMGEKLLPLVIDALEFFTDLLTKFNALSPETQDFIFKLAGIAIVIGPLMSVFGTLMKVAVFFSSAGSGGAAVAWIGSTLIPAIISIGTAIWGALLPLLPIIALILAVILLVYLVWKNWDTLSVTIQQLGAILEHYLKQGLDAVGKAAEEAANKFKDKWNESINTWKSNFQQASQINQKVQKIAIEAMAKMIVDFVTRVNAKLTEFRNWAVQTWNYIYSSFVGFFQGIANFANSVFDSIIAGIQAVIDAVNELIDALEDIVLPDELTPGSPTPFEIGLRGITAAMNELSRQAIPQMNAAFATPGGFSDVGGGRVVNYTDNRRFASGITADALREALNDRFERLTQVLEQ